MLHPIGAAILMREKRGTPGHKALLKILVDGRVGAGLTQVEVAEKLRVRQSYVSNYETGERRLDVVEFVLVCAVIGLDPAGVMEQVAEAVATSPPKILKAKRKSTGTKPSKVRRGPRKRSV